ncbi:hypothetical protein PanWU01x14_341990 [Parasponia andersonii]|uniref:Uncharacterized protein n=1 Tax=Parasponia andersonii TaxID=3476 RepID=A0A2P5ADV9_PARAD|nr:hypothetical protein PanWU01x14_341990 [Parasponia andersonii]
MFQLYCCDLNSRTEPIVVVIMGEEILGHKGLFSFYKKDIVADSSLAPYRKSFADVAILDSIWKISSWRLISLGNGYFLILLTSEQDKTQVWSMSSLNINLGILRLQPWAPGLVPNEQKTTNVQVWVHFYELPWEFWHPQIYSDLARTVGIPLKIDQTTLNGDFGHFAQVLVDIDLKNPLLDSIQVESGDECRSVYLSYERFSDFCSTSSSICHVPSNCYHNKPKEDKEKINKKSEESAPKQQVYIAKSITNQVVSKDVQKSPDMPVTKIFTSLALDLDKNNSLVRFGNMEDEVEIVDNLEKNKAHYDKEDELVAIDENVNSKEDVALNHDSEHISNMDKVVNTEVHEKHIEAPTTEVGISDPKDSSSSVESKSDHNMDTSDLSPTKVFTSKYEGW